MIDRDKVLAGLVTIKLYFETKAEMLIGDAAKFTLHWANICRDAVELIELQAERIAIMETEGDDKE